MKLHQVLVVGSEKIKCREVSCVCTETPCSDHELLEVSLTPWGENVKTGCRKRKTDTKLQDAVSELNEPTKKETSAS